MNVDLDSGATVPTTRLRRELAKLPAFIRRDFLVAWSYRTAFFGDVINLAAQITMFYFLDLMIDPATVPAYGGEQTTYLAFVAIGIALGAFLALGLGRVATAMRGEQLMGTLESLFMTPTAPLTIQLGLAVYDLVYVPIRTALFLGLAAMVFDIAIDPSGVLPALAILLLLIPFVWGIGMVSAGVVITVRKGAGFLGIGALALNISSGAYFPLDLLPGWLEAAARINPIAVAFDGTREALLGGAGWAALTSDMVILAVAAGLSLTAGNAALGFALRRERAKGTLGRY